jgi:hypothetical protein
MRLPFLSVYIWLDVVSGCRPAAGSLYSCVIVVYWQRRDSIAATVLLNVAAPEDQARVDELTEDSSTS